MRVYLPVSWPQLAALSRGEEVEFPLGHAVTGEVRAELEDSDEEELEYVTLGMAASDAIGLAGEVRRRVVLVAEVDATPTGSLSEVSPRAPIALEDLAAVYVDTADAEADVVAAAGDPDDRASVERALEHELAWYGVQELPHLLAELGDPRAR